MNQCLLEAHVLEPPQVRYTQDNQTPVAEMTVQIEGLRPDDPPGQLKVVGWGNLAQELQSRVQPGQHLVLEGRLRMNTVTRQDGVKEKRAELTLARLHGLGAAGTAGGDFTPQASAAAPSSAPASSAPSAARQAPPARAAAAGATAAPARQAAPAAPPPATWNASPLVPDLPEGDDEIPF